MTRQILDGFAEFEILAQSRMTQVQTGIAKAAIERVVLIAVLPGAHNGRQSIQGFRFKAQSFAHLAGGEAAAISNDIGSHGGATLTILTIDVLDHAFALIAAGEVEVDVRPFAAFFGEHSLE